MLTPLEFSLYFWAQVDIVCLTTLLIYGVLMTMIKPGEIGKHMYILAIIVLSVGAIFVGCGDRMTSFDEIVRVQEKYESQLMSLPGVVGVGIGACDDVQPCLKVYVVEMTPELEGQIPEQLEAFTVDIEVTGPFEILPY